MTMNKKLLIIGMIAGILLITYFITRKEKITGYFPKG